MATKNKIILRAEYEPLEVDLRRLAIVVIDMQNAFVSKGGMFDIWGFDIASTPAIIPIIKQVVKAARAKNIKVIHVAHKLDPDANEIGKMTPFWYNRVMQTWRDKPEWRDKLIMKGTWGANIIDELRPLENEIIIEKQRFSAFIGTHLDMTLKTYDIRYLFFAGVATNICVESSIRDAFHLEYFPILISDCTKACPSDRYEATLGNIKQCFGWITKASEVLEILS